MFIILLMICVFSTIDTHLFVYPSLSRYLIAEIGIMIMSITVLCMAIAGKDTFSLTKYHLFITVWIGYIALHALTTQSYELYRSVYLCATLIFIMTIANRPQGYDYGLFERHYNLKQAYIFIPLSYKSPCIKLKQKI